MELVTSRRIGETHVREREKSLVTTYDLSSSLTEDCISCLSIFDLKHIWAILRLFLVRCILYLNEKYMKYGEQRL